MPPPTVLLCLVIGFSGPLFRQAEAADDLARALAHQLGTGHIEAVDGGVGDDQGDATLKAGGEYQNGASAGELPPAVDCVRTTHSCALLSPNLLISRDRLERASWPLTGAGRRRAWLQHFLF